jgi:ATP-binding cassette subfamily A (ABC1) protein 3
VFAYIKGLSGTETDQAVDYFIKVMQLSDFTNTPSDKLSGGNKRKLCVATALIGGTNMQFFDEPSSGVDPIARRFLWNTIQQGLKL